MVLSTFVWLLANSFDLVLTWFRLWFGFILASVWLASRPLSLGLYCVTSAILGFRVAGLPPFPFSRPLLSHVGHNWFPFGWPPLSSLSPSCPTPASVLLLSLYLAIYLQCVISTALSGFILLGRWAKSCSWVCGPSKCIA